MAFVGSLAWYPGFSLSFFFHLLHLGEVYTWGDNDEGQLGDGTTNAIQRPRLVAALQGKKVNRVACGSAHTLAWSTSKPASAGKLPAQVSPGGGGGKHSTGPCVLAHICRSLLTNIEVHLCAILSSASPKLHKFIL